jgi:hypothetical protein
MAVVSLAIVAAPFAAAVAPAHANSEHFHINNVRACNNNCDVLLGFGGVN